MCIPFGTIGVLLLCHAMVSSVLVVPIENTLKENVTVTGNVNRSIVYIFKFAVDDDPNDVQLKIETIIGLNLNNDSVTFVSRHDSFITTWHLPVMGISSQRSFQKTTCSGDSAKPVLTPGDKKMVRVTGPLSMTVSTSGFANVSFSIHVSRIPISIGINQSVSRQIFAHSPAIYRFEYGNHSFYSSSVQLNIRLPNPAWVCITVSIQEPSCPIFDSAINIKYRGKWFTMMSNGSLTLNRDEFPAGFYIVLFLHVDMSECLGDSFPFYNGTHNSSVTLQVNESIEDRHLFLWTHGTMAFLTGTLILCWLLSGGLVSVFTYFTVNSAKATEGITLDQEPDVIWLVSWTSCILRSLQAYVSKISGTIGHFRPNRVLYMDSTMFDKDKSRKVSREYLTSVMVVGVYYLLPVVNLVTMYLFKSRDTGNMDLCYFNFDCAFSFYPFYDFNHVYSNLGYVVLGVASLVSIKMYASLSPNQEGKGVARHSGIAYALGVSIIFEGVLSACYHVCPNKSNFRHDACFMYVSVVSMILKLYQSRHPNLKCSPATVIFCLSCFQCLDFLGQYFPNWWYFATFTALYIVGFALTGVKIYFLGAKSVFSVGTWRKLFHLVDTSPDEHATRDIFLLITLGTLTNSLVIGRNISSFADAKSTRDNLETSVVDYDFGLYTLSILIGNMAVYIFYYIIMKLIHRERIAMFPALTGIVSATLWALALKNFLDANMSWEHTPSFSRLYNKPCQLEFYDTHDLWHLYSAGALYTGLLMIHTIDEDLTDKSRKEIPVF